MRVVPKNISVPVVSFESLPLSHEVSGDLHASPDWVIEMPAPCEDDDTTMNPAKKEMFVLVQAISLSRGDQVRGRATRVWKARKMTDMGKAMKDRMVRLPPV